MSALLLGAPGCCLKSKKRGLVVSKNGIARVVHADISPTDREARDDEVTHSIASIQEYEARLVDIPVPLSALPYCAHAQEDNDGIALCYHADISLYKDIVSFYITEMERSGWRLDAQINYPDTMLALYKPKRFCIIVIRVAVERKVEYVEISVYTGLRS